MASNQYIVSARKYRPATFQTVVGQRALTATLKNAILGGKLAQAYLFCGPRGVGKTSCARIFAKTINCLNPTPDGEACGECESCKAIERGNSFNLVELDAASNNSVDDIRNITDQVNIPAQDGRYRVFIIDEVHMLSNAAFNAFLKTLEEPPKNVVFILATTERHKVIPTILSRCQVYDFRRITVNDIIDHLQYVAQSEGVEAQREALGVIALKADGAMRDALSIFDQVVASTHGKVTYQGTIEALNVLDQDYYFRLVDIFKRGDVADALLTFKEITDKGFDAQFFVNGLADHIRNLMVSADPRTVVLLETSEEWAKKYSEQAPSLPSEWYYSAIKILNDTDFNYRTSGNKRLLVELALIRLSRLLSTPQQIPVVSSSPTTQKVSPQPQPAPQQQQPQQSTNAPFVAPDGRKPHTAPATNIEAPKRRPSTRPQSFRLSEGSQLSSTALTNEPRNTTFTPQQFRDVWETYANTHPEQRILVGAMRSSLPQQISETGFKIMVDHPAQKQAFENSLSELLDFFKNRLSNDFITINVEISEKDDNEKGLKPKEFLKLIVDENPELAKFLKAVDAELE
ncbi:MAG: DNA polymerase III subunit gamma/tau [Muribaculaceae bacterium]|nr:DNA polymerase III subunit gamma/tau [Muribaculaceae bacterium]